MLEAHDKEQEYLLILYEYIDGKEPNLCTCAEKVGELVGWLHIRHFQLQATIVEIFGLDCIDNDFIDRQLQWIKSWEEQFCVEA